jgi:hypothetical protein
LELYLEFLPFDDPADVPYEDIAAKHSDVSANQLRGMIRPAKHNPLIYIALIDQLGVDPDEIPNWFQRPTRINVTKRSRRRVAITVDKEPTVSKQPKAQQFQVSQSAQQFTFQTSDYLRIPVRPNDPLSQFKVWVPGLGEAVDGRLLEKRLEQQKELNVATNKASSLEHIAKYHFQKSKYYETLASTHSEEISRLKTENSNLLWTFFFYQYYLNR